MPPLTTQQRKTLETAVKEARKLAETGARNALHSLAVNNPEPFGHMLPLQRNLRNQLRSKARLLGDDLTATGPQPIEKLSYELAYEAWHKMLFAKFLESNGLLMHPSGVAVTLEECEELAREESYTDKWEAAAAYASKMLPAIFRPDDPLIQVSFASNDRIKLEEIIDALSNDIFTADDALGWVYQFWQSEEKYNINKSGAKINGARLPAVTQLFTEPYMVHFLIDNTIGAWWVGRHPLAPPPVKFEYLRYLPAAEGEVRELPAAGTFEGWPNTTKEITSLDPCMGSGHFVATLFTVFAQLRMYEEGLSKEEATDRVITENLHGLEIDARCTQIAAFNVALTAWKFCGHYKPLPDMNLACSGIAPKGKKEDWVKLVRNEKDSRKKLRLESGMEYLYHLFQQAPELGSLIDPTAITKDEFRSDFEELQPVLTKALENEADREQVERGVMAAGIAKAGELLAKKYTLQITNVPYLGKGKMDETLSDFSEKFYADAKSDLATIFLDKLLQMALPAGTVCTVIPQNWLFLTSYKKFREKLLKNESWNLIARLGSGAFSQITGEVVKAILIAITHKIPTNIQLISGIDVSESATVSAKEEELKFADLKRVNQLDQLKNSDAVITIEEIYGESLLNSYAYSHHGLTSGDLPRMRIFFWEIDFLNKQWIPFQSTSKVTNHYGGCEALLRWNNGQGPINELLGARKDGTAAWNKPGVIISQIGLMPAAIYGKSAFDNNTAVITPNQDDNLLAIWCFCSSSEYIKSIRKIDQSLAVTSATMAKIPFDLSYWQKVAEEKYPNGLPKPYSDDPTQWLFHGHLVKGDNPLQVAVARLLGYRWPAETDGEMELAPEARELIQQVQAFNHLTDDDGIVCIPPVNGELPAGERLRSFLQTVYGTEWSNSQLQQLLTKEGASESNLEDWLRNSFFEQHNKRFQNRPFIWHIWDGRKDGFAALVNYHQFGKKKLQRLIYTYLGDWIRQCEAKKRNGESGAEGLLSAALKLKEKLEAILQGEHPHDIFIRWKPLEQQPVGWEPDLNDGVRLNIRPFVTAGILRNKFNIKWGIDRGKNPPKSHWGEIRDNDRHLSLEEKRTARENKK